MPGIEGDFTDNPQLQEIIEYLRGTILPTDVQTGEVTTDQSGVEAPNIGSDLSPFNAIYAKRFVVGGVTIVITDLANFSPFIITREASAPATGRHRQTFNWPFETLTGAVVQLVGPQSGGGGGQGGFYARPDFLSPYDFDTRPNGGWQGSNSAFGRFLVDDNADVARATLSAGASGVAATASFALEGLSLGSEITLGFGKGGAGGAGGLGAQFPSTQTAGVLGASFFNGRAGEAGEGSPAMGSTWLGYDGRFQFAGNIAGEFFPAEVYGDLILPEYIPQQFYEFPYISLPGGTGFNFTSAPGSVQTILGGDNHGIGGSAGLPAQGNTGTPARAGSGGDGMAGHDGFALIYPRQ